MGTILSFLFFTGLVGFITYLRTHNDNLHSSKGYFLAGNSLNGWVIAGSLLLTNLSAANFTGMTANVYAGNLAPIAWTVTVIPPLIYFSAVLLPTFLRGGFTTIPEFLENRFNKSTRRLVAILFLFSYIASAMPVALYGGSIVIDQLFEISANSGLSTQTVVWILVWSLGIIGGIYALFGGLKGVAISDTLNGIGLLAGGAFVFFIGVYKVGHNSILEGFQTILTKNTQILDAVGDATDGIPFSVLFTGMLIHNLFFWSTNQFIIQRTLGARSLKEGQKGVMIASFFKILNVCYIAFPGIIAFHLYGPNFFDNNDTAFPYLIQDIMPSYFIGFFAAVIFGTVLSTFNSVLNSSVTIFALDVYKPIFGKNLTDNQVIQRSKRIGILMAIATMLIAPFIMYFPEGIFTFMVKVDSLFGAPIFMVMLLGYFSKKVSPLVANICLGLFLLVYGSLMFFIQPSLHYLHYMAILFVLFIGLALLLGHFFPHEKPEFRDEGIKGIDMTPWKHFKWVSILATLTMVAVYILFSPWGLVDSGGGKTIEYGLIVAGLVTAFLLFGLPLINNRIKKKA
jgi:solute:Na+ symporter, SSS family